ncbi:MAG: CDP-2,3-bis-(O-geranylgeranyl)-sn-glycerol synthase [Methanobacteriota archaeon]
MWDLFFDAVWFILPAYVANSAAIDVSGIPFLKKYSTPIDLRHNILGKRILGDGKTWRGLFGGVIAGTLIGILQLSIQPYLGESLPQMTVKLALLLSFGALFGDMAASFVKRQTGFDRGASVPGLDQLDYIVGAFVFSLPAVPFDLTRFLIIVVLTIPLHVLANYVAYKIKLKEVWW